MGGIEKRQILCSEKETMCRFLKVLFLKDMRNVIYTDEIVIVDGKSCSNFTKIYTAAGK